MRVDPQAVLMDRKWGVRERRGTQDLSTFYWAGSLGNKQGYRVVIRA